MANLPEGFILDEPSSGGLPEGFVIDDTPPQAAQQDSQPITDNIPEWGRQNPNVYGAVGAIKETLAPLLEAGGLVGGGMIGTGAGPAGTVGGAAGGYAIAKNIERRLDELLGNIPPQEFIPEAKQAASDVATGAGLEMGGQAIGKLGGMAIGHVLNKSAAKGVGSAVEDIPGVQRNIAEATAAEKATNIPLYKAQKTLVPTQLEQQSFVMQLPAGTRQASVALRKQNEAASKAIDEYLNTIAPPESIIAGPERFRTAAQKAVDAMKTIRSEKVSPLYDEAFTEGAKVNLSPVKELIDTSIKEFPKGGEVYKSLLKVKGLISGGKGQPTLKQLHNAKLEIDQMISKFGEGSLGNTTKREILNVKNALLEQMDKSSGAYREARKAFEEASPYVTALEDSIIGKMARVEDTQLKNISKRILDPAETNPEVLNNAKKIIKSIDPEAWDMIVRSEIERRVGSIKMTNEVGVENIPSQLHRAIFGNEKQSRVLFDAIDGPAKSNLRYLETALRRARTGRATGSQTAAREEIKKELRGGVIQSIRDFIKSPLDKPASVGEDAMFNRRVKSLADSLFNPKWQQKMSEIKKYDINSEKAGRLMTALLSTIDEQEKDQQ